VKGTKPRILIVGTARSGTTNLSKALKYTFGLQKLGEPWNQQWNDYHLGPDTEPFPFPEGIKPYSLVKTLVQQLPRNKTNHVEFLTELSGYFDKTILLSRRDLTAMALSFEKAKEIGHWHTEYVVEDESKYNLDTRFHKFCQNLLEQVADILNLPITWYEELYSGDRQLFEKEVNKWELDIDIDYFSKYFDPEDRLRKFIPKKTTI